MTDELKKELIEAIQFDRRHKNNFQQWAVIIAMAIQFAGFIWQASRINATVENQQTTTAEIQQNMKVLTTTVIALAQQVAVNGIIINNLDKTKQDK